MFIALVQTLSPLCKMRAQNQQHITYSYIAPKSEIIYGYGGLSLMS